MLEIGCGLAGPIYRLDSSFKVGIEPMALAFYRKFGQPNNTVHLVQGVGERLPFASSCFDVVVLWNVVDHAFAPLEVLNEARRVLTSQGVLALWVHAIRPFAALLRPLGDMLDTGHSFHLTVGQYTKLLGEARFEIVHMKRKPFRDKGATLKRRIARRFVENVWTVASAR